MISTRYKNATLKPKTMHLTPAQIFGKVNAYRILANITLTSHHPFCQQTIRCN